MNLTHRIRQALWRLGWDVVPFNPAEHPLARRARLLQHFGIDTVVDVGANTGQFGRQLRQDLGYTGRIVSFEPLGAAFAQLQRSAAGDPGWQVFQMALGAQAGVREIHVAANSESSSLLEMLPAHVAAAPNSAYCGREQIRVETLDGMFEAACPRATHVYLKIDTQGYEREVLQGAAHSLDRIDTIQVEMSLVPLYAGQVGFTELLDRLHAGGYTLVAVENTFGDPRTGQLLQIDGTFHRFRDPAQGPAARRAA